MARKEEMHDGGYRKVSKKARHGKRGSGHAHGSHRKKLPEPFDQVRARERRVRINNLRAGELEAELNELAENRRRRGMRF